MTERDPKTGRFPKGNGAGWGGAAKGASTSRLRDAGDAYSDAVRALKDDPAHRAVKQELQADMLAIQIEIARNGETESNRLNAADKVLDRLGGKPRQQTDVTSGGERLQSYVMIVPPEADSVEEWEAAGQRH